MNIGKMKEGKKRLASLPSCDKPGNKVKSYLKLCTWGCGRTTRNITGIGDLCWANRENIKKASGQRLPTARQIAETVRISNRMTRESN